MTVTETEQYNKSAKMQKLKERQAKFLLGTPEYAAALKAVCKSITEQAQCANSEATVVSAFEIELYSLINDFFNLKFFPQKEVSVNTQVHVSKGRIDSKIGALILEFKQPSALHTEEEKNSASSQLEDYLKGLFDLSKQDYLGAVTDGQQIKFIYLDNGFLTSTAFEKLSPSHLDKIVRCVLSLEKVALTPANLVRDFCEGTPSFAQRLSRRLYKMLSAGATDRSEMLFNEWKELFRLAHDDKSKQAAIQERRKALEEVIGESFDSDIELEYKALYSIQTTYAIIIKIIAFKVITNIHFKTNIVNFNSLADADSEALRHQMLSLEDGAIFRSLGIGNLLEGDFFSWYCTSGQWNNDLYHLIKEIFSTLSKYEDKGIFESSEKVQDLFRDLFMRIIPDKVRHSLGEYYTPSWLADNLVQSVLRDNPREKWTALDPCSGSGTFVTTLIRYVLNENKELSPSERLRDVLNRVKGIDLNPLAVLTSRINYFINVSHLIEDETAFEIPIYLGDSSYVPTKETVDGIVCLSYTVQTIKGPIDISLPQSACENSDKFSATMTSIEQDIKNLDRSTIETKLLGLVAPEERTDCIKDNIASLADKFVYLEQNHWNGIWARIVTNFLATANLGKFDYIVGNPPWIDWKNLPAGYRDRVKQLCIDRNLFSGDSITGGINLNICALISYVAASNWLKPDGTLAFLMPDTILYQQTYEGFRKLKQGDSKQLYFQKIFDWTKSGHPFSPVTQRFYTFFIGSDEQDYKKGISVTRFVKNSRVNLSDYFSESSYDNISSIFKEEYFKAGQVNPSNTIFSLAESSEELDEFSKVVGDSYYTGREGIEFYPQELFLLNFLPEMPRRSSAVAVTNFQNPKSKYKIPKGVYYLETAFLYPLVKGKDVSRFHVDYSGFVVPFPYENLSRAAIPPTNLSQKAPLLAAYFNQFKDIIEAQTDYNNKIIGEQNVTAFYSLARVGAYSYGTDFVVFRDNSKWGAAVISEIETPWGEMKRPAFQNHAVSISQDINGRFITNDEAHYICAVLNSSSVTKYIVNSSDSRTFKINVPVNIPQYNPENKTHCRLSELSKIAHKHFDDRKIMQKIDDELDALVLTLKSQNDDD